MITQVSGLDVSGVKKDPRRKAQSVRFKRQAKIPYKSSYSKEFEQQQKNALNTSVAIVGGSMLFTIGYFLLSGLRK